MKKQKKNDSGITLVALVVSIIVMLVLAGVSLNATIGENGIVTRAQEATLQHKIAEDLENLNLELAKLNVDTITTDETMAIQDIANYLVGKGTIDSFVKTSAGQIAAGIDTATGNKYFFGTKGDNTYRITRGNDGLLSAELTTNASGGDITGGYALVTAENFNNDSSLSAEEKGKFTITSDAEVVFMDTITGALSINVSAGVHATVGIYANMTLTNQGIKRSAIDIAPTATLDLYIGEGVELTVNSGIGSAADQNNAPGSGGYAGIHVPGANSDTNGDGYYTYEDIIVGPDGKYNCAVLNLYGNGTIKSYGGDAGDASLFVGNTGDGGGSGGGGAGAGIGGQGGNGGQGRSGTSDSGYAGESCGIVNIYDTLNVYAFGGNCGAGAGGAGQLAASGSGYPAAGIGGGGAGGAGGSCCAGGGGYQGGTPQPGGMFYRSNSDDRVNEILSSGVNGYSIEYTIYDSSRTYDGYWGVTAGSYYSDGLSSHNAFGTDYYLPSGITNNHLLCGLGGCGYGLSHLAGNGGRAGSGGIINSESEHVYAYNGSRLNDGNETKTGNDQAAIYAQLCIKPSKYIWYIQDSGIPNIKISTNQDIITASGYTNSLVNNTITLNNNVSFLTNIDMSTQGIGSGAGYIEISNGTYN